MAVKGSGRKGSTKDAENAAFGSVIRTLRRERGHSQEQLAEGCNSSQVYISELEGGRREPCLSMILRLAHALEVKASELIEGTVANLTK